MGQQNSTFKQSIVTFLVFVATLGIIVALAVALMVVGIYWAFETLFSVGWWCSLVIMLSVAALYLTALIGGCKLLKKGNE